MTQIAPIVSVCVKMEYSSMENGRYGICLKDRRIINPARVMDFKRTLTIVRFRCILIERMSVIE